MSSENRTSVPNSLNEHWMPFTSNKDFKANPRLITEAKGVYLKTHHGKTQIDASSGLFCNPLGHGRKEITEAVTKQLETLDKQVSLSLTMFLRMRPIWYSVQLVCWLNSQIVTLVLRFVSRSTFPPVLVLVADRVTLQLLFLLQ